MKDLYAATLENTDIVCFSHLRWAFVYQRPQHLLSRAAKGRRVYFIEEPIFHDGTAKLSIHKGADGVTVVVPELPHGLAELAQHKAVAALVDGLLQAENLRRYVAWYYTPMALKFTRHLKPTVTVYDCMDQLSHFLGAPPEISILERELFSKADVVFTGGMSLFEAKRDMHDSVHPFPSSVDVEHFKKARTSHVPDPIDQAHIGYPRMGFMGVIDERMDLELVRAVALARPEWNFVMVGPVVKIDHTSLPQLPNIHYLGGKTYQELPAYLAGWDVALMPFAKNDSTKFISPTKTPEYLSAGCRVVSTSIRDVVSPYGDYCLAGIGDTPEQFVTLIDEALNDPLREAWEGRVERFLAKLSWDATFQSMWSLIVAHAEAKSAAAQKSVASAVPNRRLANAASEVLHKISVPQSATRDLTVVHAR